MGLEDLMNDKTPLDTNLVTDSRINQPTNQPTNNTHATNLLSPVAWSCGITNHLPRRTKFLDSRHLHGQINDTIISLKDKTLKAVFKHITAVLLTVFSTCSCPLGQHGMREVAEQSGGVGEEG